MRTLTARPALRWLVPLAVLLAVLASFLVVSRANAKAPLADITAPELLAKVGQAKVDGLAGTVVQNADLGIPAIPGGSDSAAGKLTSLLSGSHTMRVWYGAPDQARLAVNDEYAETDLITNGTDVWSWDSRAKTATHTTLGAEDKADRKAPADAPQTPQQAAAMVIDKITPTTDVRVDKGTAQVAGQDVYTLVLTPKDAGSLVKQVTLAIDGRTFLPLSVKVFGAGDQPALSVEYSDITYGTQDASNFAFNPPAGTKLTQKALPERKEPSKADKKELEARKAQAEKDTQVVGEGWTSVVVTKLPGDAAASGNESLKGFLSQLKPVSGSWGTGRELDGTIVTAILTDDGRLAVGSVSGDALSQALAR